MICKESQPKRGSNGGRKVDLASVKRSLELKKNGSLTQNSISIRLAIPIKTIETWFSKYTLNNNGEVVRKPRINK